MLSERELAVLTLRAPYIHEHGDRPYFMHETNSVASQLKEPPYLGFFIRYRSTHGEASKYRWSRVSKVVFLEDCARQQQRTSPVSVNGGAVTEERHDGGGGGSGGTRPTLTIQTECSAANANAETKQSNTVVWRNKLFWIALIVVGEESPVYLPQVSHRLPTEEEVLQFCAYQSLTNPEEVFSSVEPAGNAAAAAAQREGGREPQQRPHGDSEDGGGIGIDSGSGSGVGSGPAQGGPADTAMTSPNIVARTYLPTALQIQKLRDFREERLTRHTWTAEEAEEAAALHAKYSSRTTGAAAAPMATAMVKVQNLQLETRLLSQLQQHGGGGSQTTVAAPAALVGSRSLSDHSLPQSSSFLSSPLRSPATASSQQLAPPQTPTSATTKRDLRGRLVYTGRSPFLPKRLHQRSSQTGGEQGTPSATMLLMGASQDLMDRGLDSQDSLGALPPSAFDGAVPSSQLLPPSSSSPSHGQTLIDRDTVESWEQEYAQQLSFYEYVSDAQRSGYINKIADITRRNALQNRRNRLAGLEFERKMDRQANFVESAGLWITDDKLRAEKASQYKAAQESEGTGKKEERDRPAAASAVAAPGGGGEASGVDGSGSEAETKEKAERRLRERQLLDMFKQKYASQVIRFDDVPDDWLNGVGDSHSPLNAEGEGALSPPTASATASPSPYRLFVCRAANGGPQEGAGGKRARSPPAAPTATTAAAARIITSQLLHRSAVSMALGGRPHGGTATAKRVRGE